MAPRDVCMAMIVFSHWDRDRPSAVTRSIGWHRAQTRTNVSLAAASSGASCAGATGAWAAANTAIETGSSNAAAPDNLRSLRVRRADMKCQYGRPARVRRASSGGNRVQFAAGRPASAGGPSGEGSCVSAKRDHYLAIRAGWSNIKVHSLKVPGTIGVEVQGR